MGSVSPLRVVPPSEPPALHDRALDNLRFIRKTMEGATSFTAVSGWGQIGMGLVALGAAPLAAMQGGLRGWLAVWIGAATLALAGGGWAIARKAAAMGESLLAGPARKCALGFGPPVLAAALLTVVLVQAGVTDPIAGLWLLLYGAAVMAGGAYSVRILPMMGAAFMLAGAVALAMPAGWESLSLAAGFGGLHIAFGAVIVRKYGG